MSHMGRTDRYFGTILELFRIERDAAGRGKGTAGLPPVPGDT